MHLDAHSDLYHEFKGNKLSNACPFARIMEEELAVDLYQYGIRTLNEHQLQQAARFKVKNDTDARLVAGTSSPYSGGRFTCLWTLMPLILLLHPACLIENLVVFSSREVINFIHQLPGQVVGCDLVEFNPLQDIDNLTANLCGKLVKELAGKMLAAL